MKQKTTKTNHSKHHLLTRTSRLFITGLLVLAFSVYGYSNYSPANAQTAQSLQNEINKLEEQNAQNRSAVEKLQDVATSYENAIDVLEHDIEETEKAISVSSARQAELEDGIKKAQVELNDQKDLLGVNIRAMYLESDISTLEMLASSKNLSEFVDKEQYRNSVKDKIVSTLEKITALKKKLNKQRQQVALEIKEQKDSRTRLASIQAEQTRLLSFNKAEQAAYNQKTQANEAKIKELYAAQEALTAQIAGGGYVSQGTVSQGEIVGYVGNTGFSTGPHLHFEARLANGQDVNPNNYIGNGWIRPVDGGYVSQSYGNPSYWYSKGYHMGIDYAGVTSRPVRAAADGEIIWRGCASGGCGTSYGYFVMIRHYNGVISLYGHMLIP